METAFVIFVLRLTKEKLLATSLHKYVYCCESNTVSVFNQTVSSTEKLSNWLLSCFHRATKWNSIPFTSEILCVSKANWKSLEKHCEKYTCTQTWIWRNFLEIFLKNFYFCKVKNLCNPSVFGAQKLPWDRDGKLCCDMFDEHMNTKIFLCVVNVCVCITNKVFHISYLSWQYTVKSDMLCVRFILIMRSNENTSSFCVQCLLGNQFWAVARTSLTATSYTQKYINRREEKNFNQMLSGSKLQLKSNTIRSNV